jgi:hypothetical protein
VRNAACERDEVADTERERTQRVEGVQHAAPLAGGVRAHHRHLPEELAHVAAHARLGGQLSRSAVLSAADYLLQQRDVSVTQRALSGTQRDISGTQRALSGTQRDVSVTQRALSGTQRDVSGTQRDISGTQRALSGTQRDVSGTQRDISGTQRDISGTQRDISGTQRDISGTQRDISGSPARPLSSRPRAPGWRRARPAPPPRPRARASCTTPSGCRPPAVQAMGKVRIVTSGGFRVGDELTRPFRHARRFPSTRW